MQLREASAGSTSTPRCSCAAKLSQMSILLSSHCLRNEQQKGARIRVLREQGHLYGDLPSYLYFGPSLNKQRKTDNQKS